jgi:chromosome segregation ATPase
MRRLYWLAAAMILPAAASPLRAQTNAPSLDDLRKQNNEVVRSVNAKQQELKELRAAVLAGPDIEALAKRADDAARSYRAIQTDDPEIKAAREEQRRAADAVKNAADAEAMGNMEIAAADEEIAAANAKLEELRGQLRAAQQKRADLRRRIEESDKVIEARKAADVASATYREVLAKKAREARGAAEDARSALQAAEEKKLADDPKVAALDKEIDALLARNRELVGKINELLRGVP